MDVCSGSYQRMHQLYERKRTLEQQEHTYEYMKQQTARRGAESDRTALNKLIQAARMLPDAPYDERRDPDFALYDQRAKDARRELESVNREISKAEMSLSNEYVATSGAGC